jgi:hypothetical protein
MSTQAKARELFDAVMKQIVEAREDLAKVMLERGMIKDKYYIEDNFEEVAEGKTLEYICTPKLKVGDYNAKETK